MNRREVTYYDVSPFAAVSAKAAASDNLQDFSNVQKLFSENMNFRSVQTCEHNYTILDGAHDTLSTNLDIALWSKNLSAAKTKLLQEPVTLDITFGGLQTSNGIAFYFDTHNNVYADIVNVKWYKDGAILSDMTFYPDSAVYSYYNKVELYNRVLITFGRLNMPGRYLKTEAIYFGIVRTFGDSELESLTINEGFDPSANSIYINSAEFEINTKDSIPYIFLKRQPFKITYNGIEMGHYYIDKSKKYANGKYSVEAVDKIGILDNTDEFFGGMYMNVTAAVVINNIVGGLFAVTLDPSLQNVPISGWLPIMKKRDALALVALAIGASVDATRTDDIKVKPIPTVLSSIIGQDRVYRSSSVEIEFPYTGVEVIEHNYVIGGQQKNLFKDTFTGSKMIKFPEPIYNLSITNGTITASAANYAVITSTGATETSLNGYSYIDSQNSVIVKTAETIEGTQERIAKVDKGYLINKNISQPVAQRLYNYYLRCNSFDGDFMMNTGSGNLEKVGDIVEIATVFDEDPISPSEKLYGQIEKLTLNLGYANIKARGIIRGN
ncbi:MAG: hypothetical protein FWD71_03340 [Oscillospiraceae bacterium]|nr:hypothetical protein [Oscillospiraceae bacterium]